MFFIQLIKEHSSSQGLFLQIIHSHNYPFLHLIKINVRCKNDKQQAKKEKGLEVGSLPLLWATYHWHSQTNITKTI